MSRQFEEEVLYWMSKLDSRWVAIHSDQNRDEFPRFVAFHDWLRDKIKDKK
jgi:hypothetical protein